MSPESERLGSPAGRGSRAPGGNLRAEVNAFVGRRHEVGEVRKLLSASRLVTLTGVGGVGKTRLGLRVAEQVRRAFPDGVWLVDLTTVRDLEPLTRDPQQLAAVVAGVLRVGEWSAQAPLGVLTGYLEARRVLLVLDNCEHLVEPVAALVDVLLRYCPQLRVLTTSREPLGIAGEVVFAVPPLAVPADDRALTLASMFACESVVLFLTRARGVVPGFALTGANLDAVAAICRRLDGLPLAIELAAAWLPALAPEQILARLSDRFVLLRRGMRAGPDRQQTLRACVDWSFELCTKPERRLWARMSVFAGECELDAVEGVCADEWPDENLPVGELLEAVAGLVDKSILVCEHRQDVVRYRMLETIRAYGQERLVAAGEQTELRRRHRDWYQRLVERADADLISSRQVAWLSRLGRELPNLRIALEFCLTEPGEAAAGLWMAAALHALWRRDRFGEGRRWLDRALSAQTGPPTSVWVRARYGAMVLAICQADIAAAGTHATLATQLAGQLRDPRAQAWARHAEATVALFAGDTSRAISALEAVVPGYRADGELAWLLVALISLGLASAVAGDQARAAACYEEMLAICQPRGEVWHQSLALFHFGTLRWRQGHARDAAEMIQRSARLRVLVGDHRGVAECLENVAWIAGGEAHHRRAATLLGAAETIAGDVDAIVIAIPNILAVHQQCERDARAALGDHAFDAAFRYGCQLTPDEAVAYAAGERAAPTPRLSRRERQVADLIAEGLSNKEIAARLVISVRTAECHVEHILTKLGLANRAQIATWTAQRTGPSGG